MGHKSLSNVDDMLLKERVKIDIFDVSCGHEQELVPGRKCAQSPHRGCDCPAVSRVYGWPHAPMHVADEPNGVGGARPQEISYRHGLHAFHLA